MVETPGPEIILSVININKANFLGSFRVIVSHKVLLVDVQQKRSFAQRIECGASSRSILDRLDVHVYV